MSIPVDLWLIGLKIWVMITFLSKNGHLPQSHKVRKEEIFSILPLRGRQNKTIAVQSRSAAGLKLFDFRPLTGNQKSSSRSLRLE
jgi:hypothetical protein